MRRSNYHPKLAENMKVNGKCELRELMRSRAIGLLKAGFSQGIVKNRPHVTRVTVKKLVETARPRQIACR